MCPVFKSFGVIPLLSMFLQMINAMESLVFWRRIAGNPSGPGADEVLFSCIIFDLNVRSFLDRRFPRSIKHSYSRGQDIKLPYIGSCSSMPSLAEPTFHLKIKCENISLSGYNC